MYKKNNRFYADWRENGTRRRRAFASRAEALAFLASRERTPRVRTVGQAIREQGWLVPGKTVDGYRSSGAGDLLSVCAHLVRGVGGVRCSDLASSDLIGIVARHTRGKAATTVYGLLSRYRRVLRSLQLFGAKSDLWACVPFTPKPAPRSATVRADELEALLAHASPAMRLLLLLCSDCALRSGTARRIAPCDILVDEAGRWSIAIRSKRASMAQVPVTERIRALMQLAPCGDPAVSYVGALRPTQGGGRGWSPGTVAHNFMRLKRASGVRLDLRLHDLRRTAALKIYDDTKDLRVTQALLTHTRLESTLHYLTQHKSHLTHERMEALKL